MNQIRTPISTSNTEVVVLGIAPYVEEFAAAIGDHLRHGKVATTPREIVTWTWRYMLVSNRPSEIAEATMIETCSYCDVHRIETVRKIESAVVRLCDQLLAYCKQEQLSGPAGLLYDLVGWINDTTPIASPIGNLLKLPPTSTLIASPTRKPHWRSMMVAQDNKLPF